MTLQSQRVFIRTTVAAFLLLASAAATRAAIVQDKAFPADSTGGQAHFGNPATNAGMAVITSPSAASLIGGFGVLLLLRRRCS